MKKLWNSEIRFFLAAAFGERGLAADWDDFSVTCDGESGLRLLDALLARPECTDEMRRAVVALMDEKRRCIEGRVPWSEAAVA